MPQGLTDEAKKNLEKDYLNIQFQRSYKDVFVWSKYSSMDALVRGFEIDFENGEKISDEVNDDMRTILFNLRGVPNAYLVKGNLVARVSYQTCAGGSLPFDQILSTFRFIR